MSLNYAKELPMDNNGNAMQEYPAAFRANARYSSNNAIVSSVLTLNDNTTVIEVAAVGQSVAVRWIPATETAAVSPFASVITTAGATSNFDHIVAKDTFRRFVVPQEGAGVSSVVGKGVQAGTYRRVAILSAAAVSSVMVSEF